MRREVLVPAVLLTAHAGATLWIAASYRRSDNPWLLLAISALPLAQASLLAAWAAWGRKPSYVRAAVVVIAVTVLWAAECHSLNLELSDDRCAAYALAFVVQVVLVGGLLATTRLGHRLVCRRREGGERGWRIQFGVRSVLGWVTAIALVLAAWKVALIRSDWPLEVVKGELFLFGGVVGAYNAVFALIVLAGVWWGRRWYRVLPQALLALVLVGAVAFSQSAALGALFGGTGHVHLEEWVIQAGFQALYLMITLVPLRLCGCTQFKEPCHGTSTCLTARRTVLPDTA